MVNYILNSPDHGLKFAIIENEFGDVGVDDAVVKCESKETVVEMMNGCICCTVRQDLVVVLKKLATRIKAGTLKLDGIVIETTGMADPAPVAQTFFVDDDVQEFARLDGIVTLVDAKHIEQHLDEKKAEGVENESIEQVAFADRLILNKCDLVTEEDLVRVEKRLRAINSAAPIRRSTKSEVSVDNVLDIKGFDLKRTLEMDPQFLEDDGEHVHDDSVTSLSIIQPGELDLDAIQEWIGKFLREKAQDVFRMKGVMAIKYAEEKFVYQAVHMIFNGTMSDEKWGKDEPRESKLVFIGKNLDNEEIKKSFAACVATPELLEKQLKALRFKVGDRVECRTGEDGWQTGKVVQLMYRDEYMQPGMVAPYQVKLDSGSLIFAPMDEDRLIRAASA